MTIEIPGVESDRGPRRPSGPRGRVDYLHQCFELVGVVGICGCLYVLFESGFFSRAAWGLALRQHSEGAALLPKWLLFSWFGGINAGFVFRSWNHRRMRVNRAESVGREPPVSRRPEFIAGIALLLLGVLAAVLPMGPLDSVAVPLLLKARTCLLSLAIIGWGGLNFRIQIIQLSPPGVAARRFEILLTAYFVGVGLLGLAVLMAARS